MNFSLSSFFYSCLICCISCTSDTFFEDIDPTSLIEEEMVVNKVPLADPYILLKDSVYYAYGTYEASKGYHVFTSRDLVTWEKYTQYILLKDDVVGDNRFWAPEVYYRDNMFYMFYAADERTAVATSSSPYGPFVQEKQEWLANMNSIDGTILTEGNETYFYFVNHSDEKGNCIYVAKLKSEWDSVDHSSYSLCLEPSQGWEQDNVNEGPTVIKIGAKYIMTYSAGGFTNPAYGIGVAVADHPLGPWKKYSGNPVFQFPQYKNTNLSGVGHNSIFKDLSGKWRMVLHAHAGKGIMEGGRYMYIVTIDLSDRPPYISFHNDLYAPIME